MGQAVLSCWLRFAVKCLYELCPQVFYARRNRRNSPSMARFLLASASMPRRPCLGISVLYSIILQTLNSCAIRPPDSTACPHHRLTPLTLRYNVLVLTCGSDGTALSACTWEAQKLHCFPLDTTKFAGGHAVCSEENYELPRGSIFPNNKNSPDISTIYPYMGSGLTS